MKLCLCCFAVTSICIYIRYTCPSLGANCPHVEGFLAIAWQSCVLKANTEPEFVVYGPLAHKHQEYEDTLG